MDEYRRRALEELTDETDDMEVEAEIVREDNDEIADRDGEPEEITLPPALEAIIAENENNETPEEQVIRWAAEHGGAINIGDRS